MSSKPTSPGLSTRCIHAGTYHDEATRGACSPVFTSSAFAFPRAAGEPVYPRYFNTPNQQVINRKLAALENGESALTFGSGMAAISTLLFAFLKPGDHAVFQSDLYGGTTQFINRELSRIGVRVSWAGDAGEFAGAIRPETRLLYIESPSNPLLRCTDIAAVAGLGKKHGALTVIDNTFATPVNQTPLDLGIDLVVHSATKYLNGHSDLNAGVVVGSGDHVATLLETATNFGGMLDSHACAQLERGLKTLAVRMRQHNANAAEIAGFLNGHTAVSGVNYPGLPGHTDHQTARRQMRGFGGMVSFELADPARVDAFLASLRVIMPALSLGGVESLACIPSQTSHRSLAPDERRRIGISDGLVRLSVGIETSDDLIADLDQALARTRE